MATAGRNLVLVACLWLAENAFGQPVMSLEEASRRVPGTFAAAHAGKQVTLQGTIAAPPVRIRDYVHFGIQNGSGHGFTLEWAAGPDVLILPQFVPGDLIRVSGVISQRAGLPVLRPDTAEKISTSTAPLPAVISAQELTSFRHLGKYVRVDAPVVSSGQNAAGDVVVVRDGNSQFVVFLSTEARQNTQGLRHVKPGDRIRVSGLASQYSPIAPHDRGFQIVVPDSDAVTALPSGWIIEPDALFYGGLALAAASGIWWIRERNMSRLRAGMRRMMALCEELLTSTSASDLARHLESVLPSLLGQAVVSLYVYNRGAKTLERVVTEVLPNRYSVNVDAPIGTLAAAAALCFRNKALLEIPNTRKSPLLESDTETTDLAGALFVPLFAQDDPVGVLAVHYRRPVARLSVEQRTGMQHLGNTIAAALRLQEQRWMRDQLLRSEKMAAAGQLISGVANDLREPLTAISDIAGRAIDIGGADASQLRRIDQAARHGVDIVQHLLAFSRMDRSEPRPLDIFGLVSSLVEMRQVECSNKGIRLENTVPVSALQVVGDYAQLEQVFLSLLLHAERSAARSDNSAISVAGRLIGKRVLISISYSGEVEVIDSTPISDSNVFDVRLCQALIQGHAGELRVCDEGDPKRAEIDLPLYQPEAAGFDETAAPVRRATRALTVLLVEPEPVLQRRIVTLIAARGHRVVPVDTYDSGLETVQRFRFDLAISADKIAGTSWVDFHQRLRRKVATFVLLTDIEQVETGPTFRSGEALVIRKPVDESELDNLLKTVETREPASK